MTSFANPVDPSSMEGNVGIDINEECYVVRTGETVEVISWDSVIDKIENYTLELTYKDAEPIARGTVETYDHMRNLQGALKRRCDETGEQACSDLSSGLSGLEGKRVKALDRHGAIREFTVGITDDWMPHHVEIRRDGSAARADRGYERVWIDGEDY